MHTLSLVVKPCRVNYNTDIDSESGRLCDFWSKILAVIEKGIVMSGVSSAAMVIVADKDMRIVRVNDIRVNSDDTQVALPDVLRSVHLLDNIDGIDRQEVTGICRTILKGRRFPGGARSFKKVISTSEMMGERWVLLLGPRISADGTVDGVIYARFRSIEPGEISQRDLDPEKYYDYLVERSSDLVFLADIQGRITFANQAIEHYTGVPARSALGKHFSEVIHPDDVDYCQAAFQTAIHMEDPLPEFRCRVAAADGRVLSVVINASVIETRNGRRVLGICRDVTESVELSEKLLARNRALSALNNIVVALASPTTLDAGLQIALEKILSALDLERGFISLVDADGLPHVRVVSGYDASLVFPGAVCPLALACSRSREVAVFDDVATDTRLSVEERTAVTALGVEAAIQVPLSRGGVVNAILSLEVPPAGELSMERMEFIDLAVGILGPAIENARLHSDLADRVNQLAMLDRLAKSINAGRDVDSVIGVCLREVAGVVDFDKAILVLVYEDHKADVFAYGRDSERASRQSLRVSDAQAQSLADLDGATIINDLSFVRGQHDGVPASGSAIVLPLWHDGSCFGVLKVVHDESNMFAERELGLMRAVAEHLAIAALNARLYEVERTKSLELEALAREAHHRIKNNLQMIAGLLTMSGDDVKSNASSAISRCLRQIKAIATVHDLLTPRSKKTKLELCECLGRVAEQAIRGMGSGECIKLEVRGDEYWTTPDRATALGIIVNELVCNAVEHAFPGGRQGVIRINVTADGLMTSVVVIDDGVGIAPGFEVSQSPDCGLGLVKSLATYGLGGSFSMDGTGKGTRATVTFG